MSFTGKLVDSFFGPLHSERIQDEDRKAAQLKALLLFNRMSFPVRSYFTVKAEPDLYGNIKLTLFWGARPDADDPGETVEVMSSFILSAGDVQYINEHLRPMEAAYLYVKNRYLDLAYHEMVEWFEVDGERYIEPHPENQG